MKPTTDAASLLAIGAHPDDIEFGCGGIIAREAELGRKIHFVVCSRGEAGSNGNPVQRTREATRAAKILGATIEFVAMGGDAHIAATPTNAIKLAAIIRRERPAIVLAPSLVENQHPDHSKVGGMARDAARLARYGGLKELRRLKPHAIEQLFFYAVSTDAEPNDLGRVLVDVSQGALVSTWIASMEAHSSQMRTRNYVELQIARARLNGLRAGVDHAIPLFPSDALVVDSLAPLERAARRF